MTWKIQAITGELTGQEISIDRDLLVGRHQSADIVLQAAEISRKHAAFLVKDQALWVQDLQSSNGTFVNDLQIEHETLLKQGDIVQFASLKFSVLEPAKNIETEAVVSSATAAQQMNDQGMPELKERDSQANVARDGMPTQVNVPKPAPIPDSVDLSALPEKQAPVAFEEPVSRVELEKVEQKNASLGLISMIVLVILALIAWLFFK